jgi:glycosyltransferase involved in cell wall biosynthesis
MNRKKLGLIFSYNEQWIGGTYYTINLIQSFRTLDDSVQPRVIVFSSVSDFDLLLQETRYPYLEFELLQEKPLPLWKKGLNRIFSRLFNKKIYDPHYKGYLDALFLFQRCSYLDKIPMHRRIYWIPDFQDKILPHFFTKEGLQKKDERSLWIASNADRLILSSEAVSKDWQTYYPSHKCKVTVLHFAVSHPEYNHIDIEALRLKYNLPGVYFFSPNQFWAHKNHMTLIKAVEILKKKGMSVVVAFSGKENDNRNPGYTESLKKYVYDHGLSNLVLFLGFLDRAEQLMIMKHARAIIQPSRFEGWSTVIEDAMAMNQPVIASNLEVNREQLGYDGLYFDVDDSYTLSSIIYQDFINPRIVNYTYSNKVESFAKGFVSLLEYDGSSNNSF